MGAKLLTPEQVATALEAAMAELYRTTGYQMAADDYAYKAITGLYTYVLENHPEGIPESVFFQKLNSTLYDIAAHAETQEEIGEVFGPLFTQQLRQQFSQEVGTALGVPQATSAEVGEEEIPLCQSDPDLLCYDDAMAVFDQAIDAFIGVTSEYKYVAELKAFIKNELLKPELEKYPDGIPVAVLRELVINISSLLANNEQLLTNLGFTPDEIQQIGAIAQTISTEGSSESPDSQDGVIYTDEEFLAAIKGGKVALAGYLSQRPPGVQAAALEEIEQWNPRLYDEVTDFLKNDDEGIVYALALEKSIREDLGITSEALAGRFENWVGEWDVKDQLDFAYDMLIDWNINAEEGKLEALGERIEVIPTQVIGVPIHVRSLYKSYLDVMWRVHESKKVLKSVVRDEEGEDRRQVIGWLAWLNDGNLDPAWGDMYLPELNEQLRRYAIDYQNQHQGELDYSSDDSYKQDELEVYFAELGGYDKPIFWGVITNPIVQLIGSILFEPIDWAITVYEVVKDFVADNIGWHTLGTVFAGVFPILTAQSDEILKQLVRFRRAIGDIPLTQNTLLRLNSNLMEGGVNPKFFDPNFRRSGYGSNTSILQVYVDGKPVSIYSGYSGELEQNVVHWIQDQVDMPPGLRSNNPENWPPWIRAHHSETSALNQYRYAMLGQDTSGAEVKMITTREPCPSSCITDLHFNPATGYHEATGDIIDDVNDLGLKHLDLYFPPVPGNPIYSTGWVRVHPDGRIEVMEP